MNHDDIRSPPQWMVTAIAILLNTNVLAYLWMQDSVLRQQITWQPSVWIVDWMFRLGRSPLVSPMSRSTVSVKTPCSVGQNFVSLLASSERPFQRPCGLRKSRQIPVTYVTSCHIVGIQPVLINRDANYNLTESATRSADLNIPEFYDTKSNYQLIVSITKCEDVQYTLIPSFFPLLKTSRTYFIQVQIGQL